MKPRKIYNQVEAQQFGERERLEPGGYICKILNVEVKEMKFGEALILQFDIADGEFKGHYKERYDNRFNEDEGWKGNYWVFVPNDDGTERDSWTASKFKGVMQDIEDSNEGFHWDWDERKLIGKYIGILFNEKEWEYNGKTGFFTNPKYTTTVAQIREGDFKIPATEYLDKGYEGKAEVSDKGDGFMNIPDELEEELPFI